MKYIVLLRGINISGKNKIPMKELKEELQHFGYQKVMTYLNSGNIIVESDAKKDIIRKDFHLIIKQKFLLDIPIFLISQQELEDLLKHHPSWWGTDDKEIYDNLIFVIPPTTSEEIFDVVGSPNEFEKVEEYKNNIFWSYQLKNYQKTNWWSKTASTSIHKQITIRSANTMKKILELCK